MPLVGKQNIIDAVEDLTIEREKQLRGIFLTGLSNIAIGTPVSDEGGRARNSWFFSALKPSSGGVRSDDKNGNSSLRSLDRMPKDILGKTLYYTNNMPYINKLEYGGFPDPVKGDGKKTIGGYSSQAPSGWVRKEMKKMQKAIRSIN